ncbi:ATP-binding protein [Corynebacterium sp.]|uniref:ATP-binding protein n=1 Tax=Corynebacterium sp. TaxID=1720 RepID=UPI0034625DB6
MWAGRRPILDAYRTAIETGAGSTGCMILINGSRGIGKTTLVNELEDIATSNGWMLLRAPSHRGLHRGPRLSVHRAGGRRAGHPDTDLPITRTQ